MFRFLHHQHRHHATHGDHHHHRGGGGRGRGPKMFDAGAMRYIVLQLIAEKPRHGYEIIKELEQRSGGGYTPSPGAIYPLLSMLLDMGHVVATADGNKKLHTITPEGEAFLAENRQFVDAIVARMSDPAESRDDLRTIMHELKHAVIAQGQENHPSAAKLELIRAILRRTTAEILALD
ncbi:PadR family transcriptional regulator [Rugamonas rivuli]|uniref:PadR family transcriptional regulator n=1 Tax=Rugamonas rivuli TaxID=2743358 RepID=A0A843SFU0_9BURK|nr:PadR family transcriptional regulator [Rugamonas rivuli]MQA21063.1 PadR family transcriptional regulator [Rugamonas rivuli]